MNLPKPFAFALVLSTGLLGPVLGGCAAAEGDDAVGPSSEDNFTADAKNGPKVAGFDFDGYRSAPTASSAEVCPEIVDAVAGECREAGGTATAVKGCATLCSVPVAEPGKTAGFDFDGYRSAPTASSAEVCPEIVDAVAGECRTSGGKATAVKGCATLCSVPVADGGSVAGYGFDGPKTLPTPKPGTACPAVLRPEQDACAAAGGKLIAASECRALCSKPIAAS